MDPSKVLFRTKFKGVSMGLREIVAFLVLLIFPWLAIKPGSPECRSIYYHCTSLHVF